MERDYAKEVETDKDNLEIDLEKLSGQYLYWSKKEVEAKEENEKAYQKLEVTKAMVSADVRTNPTKYGIDKITENAITIAVTCSPLVTKAEADVIETSKNARLIGAAVKSFDKKSSALGHLVDLWKNGYYSSRAIPKEMRTSVEEKRQNVMNESIGNTLKRRGK